MKKSSKSHTNIFQRTVPVWLLFVLTGAAAVIILSFTNSKEKTTSTPAAAPPPPVDCNTEIHQQRLKNYRFTSPLLFVDINNESDKLNTIKSSVENIIEGEKAAGRINSASVYIKKWGNGEWFTVNPNESFYTASIMKVAVMITILKMSESIPGYLDKLYPFRYADPTIANKVLTKRQLFRATIIKCVTFSIT